MPPRKRKARRQVPAPEPVVTPDPVPEPVSGPVAPHTEVDIPRQVHTLPQLLKATQELVPETDMLISRRPGDHWRERMVCVWRPIGVCLVCAQMRVLLTCTGDLTCSPPKH